MWPGAPLHVFVLPCACPHCSLGHTESRDPVGHPLWLQERQSFHISLTIYLLLLGGALPCKWCLRLGGGHYQLSNSSWGKSSVVERALAWPAQGSALSPQHKHRVTEAKTNVRHCKTMKKRYCASPLPPTPALIPLVVPQRGLHRQMTKA